MGISKELEGQEEELFDKIVTSILALGYTDVILAVSKETENTNEGSYLISIHADTAMIIESINTLIGLLKESDHQVSRDKMN